MKKKQQGVVLIWAVMTLLLLALLVIRLLQGSEVNLKMISHYQQRQNVFYAAEATLLAGEEIVYSNNGSACLIDSQDVNFTVRAKEQWWQNLNHCQRVSNEIATYWVIEDLGSEPCAQVDHVQDNDEGIKTIAHFYRVSARAKLWDSSAMVLQSTVVVPGLTDQPCLEELSQVVHSGRQSWREVANF